MASNTGQRIPLLARLIPGYRRALEECRRQHEYNNQLAGWCGDIQDEAHRFRDEAAPQHRYTWEGGLF